MLGWSGGVNDLIYKWVGVPSAIPTAGLQLWLKADAELKGLLAVVTRAVRNDVIQPSDNRGS